MNIQKYKHGDVDTFIYKDLPAIQVWGVMDAFTKLSESHEFSCIIELGTDYGGLTNALAENPISDGAYIHTFDINHSRFKNYHPDKITAHMLDIYNNWDRIIQIARSYPGKVLFLCDGGSKKDEYEYLADKLQSGDCIMVHDYYPNEEAFNQGIGRWNWWEFSDDHSRHEGLVKSVNYFDQYVWFFRERL